MKIAHVKDYREFLNFHAELKQRSHSQWNYSLWAKALGLQSASSLTKVLKGERHPGPKMVDQFVRYFKFTADEETQFRGLVLDER